MKTAVEYLEEAIRISNKDTFNDLAETIIIAKEMEKIQITNAYDISKKGDNGTGEDYYNYLINDYSE
jgi:hypothetical protein